MANQELSDQTDVLQGTLDLLILRTILTDEDDPTRRELLAASFLDGRVFDDKRLESEILEAARKADRTKSFDDVKGHFELIRGVVTEDMPDFVDTSRQGASIEPADRISGPHRGIGTDALDQ